LWQKKGHFPAPASTGTAEIDAVKVAMTAMTIAHWQETRIVSEDVIWCQINLKGIIQRRPAITCWIVFVVAMGIK
jgi:hypothetical protein